MILENLLSIETYGGKYRWRLSIGHQVINGPYVEAIQLDPTLKRIIAKKIRSMVAQRKYQLTHHLTGMEVDTQDLKNLEAKITYSSKWKATEWRRLLGAMVPGLSRIAPQKGRFVETWQELFVVINEVITNPRLVPSPKMQYTHETY